MLTQGLTLHNGKVHWGRAAMEMGISTIILLFQQPCFVNISAISDFHSVKKTPSFASSLPSVLDRTTFGQQNSHCALHTTRKTVGLVSLSPKGELPAQPQPLKLNERKNPPILEPRQPGRTFEGSLGLGLISLSRSTTH